MKASGMVLALGASLTVASVPLDAKDAGEDAAGAKDASLQFDIMAGDSFAMPGCYEGDHERQPTRESVKSVINVILPETLHFKKKKNIFSGGFRRKVTVGSPLSPLDEDGGTENSGGDEKLAEEPFHVFLKDMKNPSNDGGFVKIKVVKKKDSDILLGVTRDEYGNPIPGAILGVAASLSDNKTSRILCGNTYVGPQKPRGKDREVAIFYVNIDEFEKVPQYGSIPFNIWIFSEDFPNTPIIIDPAVRNEG